MISARRHPFERCRVDPWWVQAQCDRLRCFASPSVACEWLAAVARRRSRPLSPWPPLLLGLRRFHPSEGCRRGARLVRLLAQSGWVLGRASLVRRRSIRFLFSGGERGADLACRRGLLETRIARRDWLSYAGRAGQDERMPSSRNPTMRRCLHERESATPERRGAGAPCRHSSQARGARGCTRDAVRCVCRRS